MTHAAINQTKSLPTLDAKQVPPQVFLRKLDRKADWEPPTANLIFNTAEDVEHSLYFVSSDEDLHRTVVSLNLGRNSFKEKLDFIWIFPDELEKANIPFAQTDSGIFCIRARKQHHDAKINIAKPTDKEALNNLVLELAGAKRQTFRITASEAGLIADQLKQLGCQFFQTNRDDHIKCKPCSALDSVADRGTAAAHATT